MTFTKEVIDLIIKDSWAALISHGADGANVMSGKFARVAEILRSEHFQWLIYFHCTARCLILVVNDIIKESVLAYDIMTMIKGHWQPKFLLCVVTLPDRVPRTLPKKPDQISASANRNSLGMQV